MLFYNQVIPGELIRRLGGGIFENQIARITKVLPSFFEVYYIKLDLHGTYATAASYISFEVVEP